MKIFIEFDGPDDLKDLVNSVNAEEDVDEKRKHVCEFLNNSCNGDFDRIHITVG